MKECVMLQMPSLTSLTKQDLGAEEHLARGIVLDVNVFWVFHTYYNIHLLYILICGMIIIIVRKCVHYMAAVLYIIFTFRWAIPFLPTCMQHIVFCTYNIYLIYILLCGMIIIIVRMCVPYYYGGSAVHYFNFKWTIPFLPTCMQHIVFCTYDIYLLY